MPEYLQLPQKAKLTTTGLELPKGLPIEDWLKIGESLRKINGAIQWALGDWINYGEREYGERYSQALEASDYSNLGSLYNIAYVSRTIETSRRREDVLFSQHAELAVLPPDKYEEVMDKVEEEKLSVLDTKVETTTSRGFLIPTEEAEKLCLRTFVFRR